MWQNLKNIYHFFVALLANVWYGWPSRRLTVIGVTGTDGKTTTVNMIYQILKKAGKKVSMVSSIGAVIGGRQHDIGFHVTTPSSFALQRFLKKAVEEKSDFLVLEVTSHALDQNRVFGTPFTVAVLTNITHEHLDYHKTYENYVKTKAKLLQMAKVAVVNRDDNSYGVISNFLASRPASWLGGLGGRSGQFPISNKIITYGIRSKANFTPKTFPFKASLMGEFNKYNCLAAIAACKNIGIGNSVIKKALTTFRLPLGRAEIVYKNSFQVMIDFAHTPNALEQILSSVHKTIKGRIIHVFGSAGKRDFAKRPKMGAVSSKYADVIVLTAEDPRGEPVEKIIDEIVSGIKDEGLMMKNKTLWKIADRQEAITAAIKMAKKGDLILITGKGHEKSMNYGLGEKSWSEHKAAEKVLSAMINAKW